MWNRSDLKRYSKDLFGKHTKTILLCTLFIFIVSGVISFNININSVADSVIDGKRTVLFQPYGINTKFLYGVNTSSILPNFNTTDVNKILFPSFYVSLNVFLFLMLFQLVVYTFLISPIKIGYKKLFLDGYREDKITFSNLFWFFENKTFIKVGIKIFIKNLYLSLWSLLFIIPGIVKTYEYYYVDYILCDNPDMSINDAILLSRKMTNDDKFNIFVLDLSFILWILGSGITFGLLEFFVHPYREGTKAKLYLTVKNSGKLSDEELNYIGDDNDYSDSKYYDDEYEKFDFN